MNWARLSVLGISLAIAACGGGSGDPFSNGGTPPSASFKIDNSNAVATARASYNAAIDSSDLAGIGGGAGFSASAPGGLQTATHAREASGLILNVISYVPFALDPENCGPDPSFGTITLSGDIAALGTLTPGDTFRVDYDMCDQGLGEVIDGVIDLTVVDFSGTLDPPLYMLAMDAVITNLQVVTAADTVTGNGDARVTLDTQQAPFVSAGVSGTSLTMDANASSETLRNYVSSQTFDGNQVPAEYTLAASGTLNSTQLPGDVTYGTDPEFVGLGENYPQSGSLLVRGDASSVRLVAVDDQNVRIEIDTNGDGTVDETLEMTWDEFANSAS